jgi:hypothetical protein
VLTAAAFSSAASRNSLLDQAASQFSVALALFDRHDRTGQVGIADALFTHKQSEPFGLEYAKLRSH